MLNSCIMKIRIATQVQRLQTAGGGSRDAFRVSGCFLSPSRLEGRIFHIFDRLNHTKL